MRLRRERRLLCNFILHCFIVQGIKQTSSEGIKPTTDIFGTSVSQLKDFILTNHFNLIPYSLILLGLN